MEGTKWREGSVWEAGNKRRSKGRTEREKMEWMDGWMVEMMTGSQAKGRS